MNLDDGFREVPFGDILADSKDGEWGLGEQALGHTECWMIRGTDFPHLSNPAAELPVRWIADRAMVRKKLEPGDIVFEMAGGTSKQSTGRSALVRKRFFAERGDRPVLCASFCRHLRLKPDYDSTFIYYLLQALYSAGYMSVFNIQHTGVSRFQYTSFRKKTVLRLPDRDVQRKLGAILSAYDELIDNNRRRIALLEKQTEEIYREWFVRFRFPSHEKVPLLKGIPSGWAFVGILELAAVRYGKTLPTKKLSEDGRYPVYGAAKIIGRFDQFNYKDRTIITGCRGSVGQMSITLPNSFVTNNSFAIQPHHPESFFWLYHTLRARGLDDVIGGSAQPQITIEGIKSAKLMTPLPDLRENFNQVAQPIYNAIWSLEESNLLMAKARDLLLPRLLSGKLSVKNLDIQFPPGMAEEAQKA